QLHDVSGFRATRTHAGEGFVTRRIQENNLPAVSRGLLVLNGDFVSTDVLRNSAGLATSYVRKANGVEQRGLTVIDMAHDGYDWRTGASFRRSSFACGGSIRNFFRRV